jgi:type VI secretion system secreted protein VgrG
MASNTQAKFAFTIQGFDQSTFHVVRFNGEEGLSRLYRFEIVLYAGDKDVDFEKALTNTATFTIKRSQGDIPFHGILERFEQLSHSGPYAFYRAVLVPKAWWLTLTTHNQVFLDQNIEQFLTAVLKDGGLSPGLDFRISLQNSYPTWDYLCQYDETHFEFASRWMERDGLYYFFEQGDSGEKMVVTDTLTAHGPMSQGASFRYSPPSSMQVGHEEEVVTDFILTQRRLPQKVQLRDYNYQTPSLELTAEQEVSQNGQGTHYLYGLHFLNTSQGKALASIRAQEFTCREKVFTGVSGIPFVRPGYTFKIESHYRDSFNQTYQTTACTHEGSQEAWLVSGLGLSFGKERDTLLFYRNTFTAIPASAQFRAELATDRPRIAGTLSAKVDAAGSGKYAEVDSQGRYKIILPFDLSGRKDGRASAWVRMAQPYAGEGFGMHMPLHKGCEVLLTFEGGDPDRPVIASAVPNPETASPVTDQNQTQARITTSGGNLIHFEDQEGSQRILLSSPTQKAFVRIGSHNDPDDEEPPTYKPTTGNFGTALENWEWVESPDGLKLFSAGPFTLKAQESFEMILGNKNDIVVGVETGTTLGAKIDSVLGGLVELQWPSKLSYSMAENRLKEEVAEMYVTKTNLGTEVTNLIATNNNVKAEVNNLITAKTNLCATKQELTTAKQDVSAEVAQTYATKNEMTAQKDTIAADYTQAIANKTSTLASKEEVIAAKNEVAGSVEQVRGTLNQQAGSIQQMTGDINTLSGNVTVLAAAVEYM